MLSCVDCSSLAHELTNPSFPYTHYLHAEVESPEAPIFITHPNDFTTMEGEDATLSCKVRGQPRPNVMWEKDGVVISPSAKYKTTCMGNEHTLTIMSADPSDQGEFLCHAHNTRGSTSYTCVVRVRGLPQGDKINDAAKRNDGSNLSRYSQQPERLKSHRRLQDIQSVDRTPIPQNNVDESSPNNISDKFPPRLLPQQENSLDSGQQPGRISFLTPTSHETLAPGNEVRLVVKVPGLSSKGDTSNERSKKEGQKEGLKDFRSVLRPRPAVMAGNKSTKDEATNQVDFREILSKRKKDPDCVEDVSKGTLNKSDSSPFSNSEGFGLIGSELRTLQVARNSRNARSRGGDGPITMSKASSSTHSSGSQTHREFSFQRSPAGVNPLGLKSVNRSLGAVKASEQDFGAGEGIMYPQTARERRWQEQNYSPSSSLEAVQSSEEAMTTSIDNAPVSLEPFITTVQTQLVNLSAKANTPELTTSTAEDSTHLSRGRNESQNSKFEININDKPHRKDHKIVKSESQPNMKYSEQKSSNNANSAFNQPQITQTATQIKYQSVLTSVHNIPDSVSSSFKPISALTKNKTSSSSEPTSTSTKSLTSVNSSGNKDSPPRNSRRPTSDSPFSLDITNDDVFSSQSDISMFAEERTPVGSISCASQDSGRSSILSDDPIPSRVTFKQLPEKYENEDKSWRKAQTRRESEYDKNNPKSAGPHQKQSPWSVRDAKSTSSSPGQNESNEAPDDFRKIKLKPSPRDVDKKEEFKNSKYISKSTESLFSDVKLKPVATQEGFKSGEISKNASEIKSKSRSSDLSQIHNKFSLHSPFQTSQKDSNVNNVGKSYCDTKQFRKMSPEGSVERQLKSTDSRKETSLTVTEKKPISRQSRQPSVGVNSKGIASKFEKAVQSKSSTPPQNKFQTSDAGLGVTMGIKKQSPRDIAAKFEASLQGQNTVVPPKNKSPQPSVNHETVSVSSKPPVPRASSEDRPVSTSSGSGLRSRYMRDTVRGSTELTKYASTEGINTTKSSSSFMDKLRKWREEDTSPDRPKKTLAEIGKSQSNSSLASPTEGNSHLDNIPTWIKQKALSKRGSLQLGSLQFDRSASQPDIRALTLGSSLENIRALRTATEQAMNDRLNDSTSSLKDIGRKKEYDFSINSKVNDTKKGLKFVTVATNNTKANTSTTEVKPSNVNRTTNANPVLAEARGKLKRSEIAEDNVVKRSGKINTEFATSNVWASRLGKDTPRPLDMPVLQRQQNENDIGNFRSQANNTGKPAVALRSIAPPSSPKATASDDQKPVWMNRAPVKNIEGKIKANLCSRNEKDDQTPEWAKTPKTPRDVKDHKIDRHTVRERKLSGVPDSPTNITESGESIDATKNVPVTSNEDTSKVSSSVPVSNSSTVRNITLRTAAEVLASSDPSDISTKENLAKNESTTGLSPSSTQVTKLSPQQPTINTSTITTKHPPQQESHVDSTSSTSQSSKNIAKPPWMKQKSLRHIPLYPILDNELSPRYEPLRQTCDDTASVASTTSTVSDTSMSSSMSESSHTTGDSGYGRGRDTETEYQSDVTTGKIESYQDSENLTQTQMVSKTTSEIVDDSSEVAHSEHLKVSALRTEEKYSNKVQDISTGNHQLTQNEFAINSKVLRLKLKKTD
jgi:hypothetical protein